MFNNCIVLEGGGVFIYMGFFLFLSVDNCNFIRCNMSGFFWGGLLVVFYGIYMNIIVDDSYFMFNYGGVFNIYLFLIFGVSWIKKS